MKNKLVLLIGIAVVCILLAYMFTFQVRYDQVAVLTTFDQAKEPAMNPKTGKVLRNASGRPIDPGSLKVRPGLYFKAPWPIQKVYNYPTQVQLLNSRLQETQTADGSSVIVELYLAWKIEDPYAFFRSLSNIQNAKDKLKPLLADLTGVVSQFRFNQLVNTDPKQLKLHQLEDMAADRLRQRLARIKPSYGISIEQVGVTRVVLPEATTDKVFARMRKTRERLAEAARAEGKSQAATIKARAQSAQQRILAFAHRRAQAIRDEGNREAAQYFTEFHKNPEFAVYLRQIDALKKILAHNTTFILDANKLWFLAPLKARSGQPRQAANESNTHKPAAAAETASAQQP